MTVAIIRSPNPAIRLVNRDLADARDEQILRAVAMVDAMADRGQADQIVAPLRQRLARLRPPRPLRFARLLFLPLDPLIVPAARWRLTQPVIPRTVIPIYAAAVALAAGGGGADISALIAGHTTADGTIVEAAGQELWPLAAQILMDIELPPNWETTGLAAAAHRPLSRRIGALLAQAMRLRRLTTDAAQGVSPPDTGVVRSIVLDAIGYDRDVQPMLIALLLARVPDAGPVLARVASGLGQRGEALLRGAGEDAHDILLDQLEQPGAAERQLGGDDLSAAGAAARRLNAMLTVLEPDKIPPGRRERLTSLRRQIVASCETLFTERIATDLIGPLRTGGTDTGAAMENAARGLRVLETEARRMGGGKTFDGLLGQASGLVREAMSRGELGRADGVRLMEILAGPEAALALLGIAEDAVP